MVHQNYEKLDEARAFLAMMCRAYHEVWRLRPSGKGAITPKAVLVLYAECERHRGEVARISIEAMENDGELPPAELQGLDAVWRSLWLAVNGKRPRYEPPRVEA